jgi:hypothetical protein
MLTNASPVSAVRRYAQRKLSPCDSLIPFLNQSAIFVVCVVVLLDVLKCAPVSTPPRRLNIIFVQKWNNTRYPIEELGLDRSDCLASSRNFFLYSLKPHSEFSGRL